MASYLQRGRPINGQSREIIFNVYKYFVTEANKFKYLHVDESNYFCKIRERVAQATGISKKSIYTILQEAAKDTPATSFQFNTPTKARKKKHNPDGSTTRVESKPRSKLKNCKTESKRKKQSKLQQNKPGVTSTPNESISLQNSVHFSDGTIPKNDTTHVISMTMETSLHNNAESRQTNPTSHVISTPTEISEQQSNWVMIKTETEDRASQCPTQHTHQHETATMVSNIINQNSETIVLII